MAHVPNNVNEMKLVYYRTGPEGIEMAVYARTERPVFDNVCDINRICSNVYIETWKAHEKLDPDGPIRFENERKQIKSLFDSPIYMEPIPNGYCPHPCCIHKPWFNVTTEIGPIKIGWRKKVISIDWSRTTQKKSADELFPNEDVTKIGQSIDAWGEDAARAYLKIIHEIKNDN